MSEEIILPDGYTRIDSIGGYGTQYIILPVNMVEGDVVELITVQRFLEITNQSEGKSANPFFFFGIRDGKWYAGCGSSGISSESADTDWHTFRMKYTPNSSDGGFWVDDEKYRDCDGTANVLPTYISVFRTHNTANYTKCYKKSWKLYVNDELRYDLIPCLDNNGVPCMYDLVGGGTYKNRGTGTFGYISDPYENNEDYESELPAGYTKCLYLQSDGTQYINTSIYKDFEGNDATSTEDGIIPTDETGLYIKAQRLNNGNYVPFGSNGSSSRIYPPRIDTSSKNITYGWNTYTATGITYDKGDDLIYSSSINLYNDRLIHFNSEDTDWDGYITESLSSIGISIGLFSINDGGTFLSSIGKWGGRIYRAKITQGTTLIRDFVPCLDATGVPCMYDLVTGGSYYNQGSGSDFEYCIDHKLPSDFVKLKYLESTGTQYIKTGYVPSNTTGVYTDAYNTYKTTSSTSLISLRQTYGDTYYFAPRVMKQSSECAYGWGKFVTLGGYGNVRYETYMNYKNDRKVIVKAPSFADKVVENLAELPFTPTFDLCMFGIHDYDGNYRGSSYRIYRLKITDLKDEEQKVVRDYVPAFDQRLARPCMYDIVNNVAYYNDGTGEFLYNRDFEGDYEGFTQLGGIGNRVGGYYVEFPLEYIDALFLTTTANDQGIYTNHRSINGQTVEIKGRLPGWGGIFGQWYVDIESGWQRNLDFALDTAHNSYFFRATSATRLVQYWFADITFFTAHDHVYFYDDSKYILTVDGVPAGGANYTNKHPYVDAPLALFGRTYVRQDLTYKKIESYAGTRVFYCKITAADGTPEANYVPAIDEHGVPCMYDKITQKPFYEEGGGSFIVGLTKYQARELFKLPPTTNRTLTISLPASIVDADGITITDAMVKSAKEKAEENGWRFTIQTYTE